MSDVLLLGVPLVVVVGAAFGLRAWARRRVPDRRKNLQWRLANVYLAVGVVALPVFVVLAVLAAREE